ncbi:hypothetical protein ANN_08583 [Periplaneta americana]|uniref:Uncharacterized protein n=1 Tax=Periplaneta americana TaxID=6978 RepID=A0ABQ8T1U0_PERAM|nr:hypothetical protein ANN_08583 [Periplaneta americana]
MAFQLITISSHCRVDQRPMAHPAQRLPQNILLLPMSSNRTQSSLKFLESCHVRVRINGGSVWHDVHKQEPFLIEKHSSHNFSCRRNNYDDCKYASSDYNHDVSFKYLLALEIADDVPTFKVLVVGNSGTGKTSLALRYVHKYKGITKPAVGYDFFVKSVKVGDKTVMKMELWDLPGSDRSVLLTRTMYRKTDGVMIVFDITKRNTLADVLWWKEDINRKLIAMNKTVPFILVGNKCDLRKLNDESIEELRAYSTASGFDGFFLTSAKDNIEVSAAFDSLANMDFWLWGYLKERVFLTHPTTLLQLKDAISQEIANIPRHYLQNAVHGVADRMLYVEQENGGHLLNVS